MTNFAPYLSHRDNAPVFNTSTELSAQDIHPITGYLPSRASNATDSIIGIGVVAHDGLVVGGYFIPTTSQAGSATHFANLRLINLGPSANLSTNLASRSLSAAGQGVSAHQRGDMTLSSGTAISVSAGDVIGVSYASQGNGIAVVAHTAELHYRKR